MSKVQEIASAVSSLSQDQLAAFRAWFLEFDADAWDRQFEADVAAGRLDALAEEALRESREGRCTDLGSTAPARNFGAPTRSFPAMLSASPTKVTSF